MLKDLAKQIINTSKYITYLDANDLYGWAIGQYLPDGELKCLNQKEIDKFDVNSIERILVQIDTY